MIEVKEVYFSHKGDRRAVLKGFNFRAFPGEVTTILGPNGSGKTTLFKCMLGIWRPQRGDILINGTSIKALHRPEIAKRVAVVPQDHEPPFPYSVFDVVLMGRIAHVGIFASPSKRDKEVARRAMESMGLEALAERPYTRISGGERQLVLIARCLAQEATVMLLDEPTSHLDFRNQIMVLNRVRSTVKGGGLTAVMTLHDPNLALLFSDQVLLLNDGCLIAKGTPKDVLTEENLMKVYGIEVEFISHDGREMICPKV